VDAAGNLYVIDQHRVKKIAADAAQTPASSQTQR